MGIRSRGPARRCALLPPRLAAFGAGLLLPLLVAMATSARAELGPGCHPETPAVAHHADAAILDPQPAGGPVRCRSYTGFAGGESRIEVDQDGVVFFSPAPFLKGVLSLGYLPELDPDGSQWMFQQGGIAVSRDGGASFEYVEPADGRYTMDDAHSQLDRDTGKYFWSVLNESPDPDDPPDPPTSLLILYEGQILSTPDTGATWTHSTAIGPVADRPEFAIGPPPAGQPEPEGYPNFVYYCYMFSGDGICSRSLDGGETFDLAGLKHQSSVAPLGPVHPECGGSGDTDERSGAVAAACDGSLHTPVWCDEGNFLSASSNGAVSWSVEAALPSEWDLQRDRAAGLIHSDRDGRLYMMRRVGEADLLLSISDDGGHTWTPGVNVTAPGVIRVHNNWYFDVRNPGHVSATYNGRREGETTTYDGFITQTRDALAALDGVSPVFWSAMINDPALPLLYGESLVGVGLDNPVTPEHEQGPPPQVNQSGADIDSRGNGWGSFTEDCGPDPNTPRCQEQNVQTRGLAARLEWPAPAADLDFDTDGDGIGRCDNCPAWPNSAARGTCTAGDPERLAARCASAADCGSGGVCSQAQEDGDGNGTGDACEPALLPEPGGALTLMLGAGLAGALSRRRR